MNKTSSILALAALTPAADSLVSFGTQAVTYTSFDRPATIREGNDSVIFKYGCGGDAYSAPMVYVRTDNGSWTLYNIGRDYLGSITQIAYANGLPVAEYSYDPWGRLRDPQTLQVYARGDEPTLMLGRGFTGHEHLSRFGLINMNARLYDPLVGRFLSPDPYVQEPDFSQNFNRYSYALNNPLKYSDESGEAFFWSFNGKRLELGVSFLLFEVGISYTFGKKEDRAIGLFWGIGFRTGNIVYEIDASARISINYNFSKKNASFTSELQATASLGGFRASASTSYSLELDKDKKETVNSSVGASYQLTKHLNSNFSYEYSRSSNEQNGKHKLSLGLDTSLYLKDIHTGLAFGTATSLTLQKNTDAKWTMDFMLLAMPQNNPPKTGLNTDFLVNRVQPLKKSFGGLNNRTMKSFYEMEFNTIIDYFEKMRKNNNEKK